MTINTDTTSTADTSTNTNTTPQNVSDGELAAYRAWMASRVRETTLAEGRNLASAEHAAAEAEADAAILKRLGDRGLSLPDVFGNRSTDKGRGFAINLHRAQFGVASPYTRLRRIAASQGLVK